MNHELYGPIVYEIGKQYETEVWRDEANFDRACDMAWRLTINKFGIDEDGHSSRVEGYERSTCTPFMAFAGYVRIGASHLYTFDVWIDKTDEEEA